VKTNNILGGIVVALLIVLGIALMWRTDRWPFEWPFDWPFGRRPAPVATAPVDAPAAAPPPVAASAAASEPAIQYPVAAASEPLPAGDAPLVALLRGVFGAQASRWRLDDLPRRIVATVDNLGRPSATSRLWPLDPVPGRYTVDAPGTPNAAHVSPDNGLRYTPYVLMLESVDAKTLAAAYARLYPQLQQAYADLGFPNRYFNDRVVQVIDLLLATPEPSGPIGVHLPTIEGPVRPTRPWVLYEFDDPKLAALPAGQKLLIRMGPVNERRVKAKLAELRRELVAAAPAR